MQIIHGENQVESRKEYIAKKNNAIVLSGESMTLSDLGVATSSQSLFGEANTVCIEGLFSSRPSARKTEITDYLVSHNLEILLWEGRDVSAQLKSFPAETIRKFDLPKMIFAFMDCPTVELLHKCIQTMPVEQVFASLVTRLYKQEKTKELEKLLQLDYKNKTSQLPYDLVTGLELYIIESNAQSAFRN